MRKFAFLSLFLVSASLGLGAKAWALPDTHHWIQTGERMGQELIDRLMNPKKQSELRAFYDRVDCKDIPFRQADEQEVDTLYALADNDILNENFCEAAQIYKEILRQYPTRPHYQQAWIRLIITLIQAKDYIQAVAEASNFMNENPASRNEENVSFLLLIATSNIVSHPINGRDLSLTEVVLGRKKPKVEAADLAFGASADGESYMSYPGHLKAYPSGRYTEKVEVLIQRAREQLAESRIQEVIHVHLPADHYYASIMSLSLVIGDYGANVRNFQKAMYYDIKARKLFAQYVLDNEKELPLSRIRDWMKFEMNATKDVPKYWKFYSEEERLAIWERLNEKLSEADRIQFTRQQYADELLNIARRRLKIMTENYPDHKWTRRAVKLMQD